jgi:hypothetical protein
MTRPAGDTEPADPADRPGPTAEPNPIAEPDPADRPHATARMRIWPFLAWAAVGAGTCLAFLTAFTIGIFVMPLVIAATITLLRWRGGRTVTAVGVISGLGLVPLYVAYLNRGGPGDVCSTSTGGQICITEWSPWPWFTAGVALIALGVAAFALLRSRLSPRPSGPGRRPPPPGQS